MYLNFTTQSTRASESVCGRNGAGNKAVIALRTVAKSPSSTGTPIEIWLRRILTYRPPQVPKKKVFSKFLLQTAKLILKLAALEFSGCFELSRRSQPPAKCLKKVSVLVSQVSVFIRIYKGITTKSLCKSPNLKKNDEKNFAGGWLRPVSCK